MSSLPYSTIVSRPIARSIAVAALLGAAMVSSPLAVARAGGTAPTQLAQAATPQAKTGPSSAETRADTVEQRITSLHAALGITPAEESDWSAVAQAMRDNAAAMEKLIAEKSAKSQVDMTAVDDLNTYVKFAQAHVAGLKSLTSSFDTLYQSMPASQQKIADQVFAKSRHSRARAHG